MSSSNKSTAVLANMLWQKQPKTNAELFALTYGAMVQELIHDLEKQDLIQEELDRMGHSMGIRCIEEFLAKGYNPEAQATKCQNFSETADLLKMALRMMLGITAESSRPSSSDSSSQQQQQPDSSSPPSSSSSSSYSLLFSENPLTIFVELPEEYSDLEYNQLLAGLCKGMLEMLQFDCACSVEQSMLHGDDVNEIRVELQQVLQEGAGEDYQEE